MPMWITWLIISGILFILEIFTVTFLFFWPAIAALVAFALALLDVNITIQIAVFCIISIVLIILAKPILTKFFETKEVPTNAKSIIGKTGIVLKMVDNLNSVGQVKIGGEVWSAISSDDTIIPVETQVEVLDIQGVKLKVKKL